MRLEIVTLLHVVVDVADVVSVSAEDATGSFALLPHHADFLTVLAISAVGWKRANGEVGYIAVRGGILRMQGGDFVQIATRQAVSGPSLGVLSDEVLDRLRAEAESEAQTRTASMRLQLGLMRQLDRYLRAGQSSFFTGSNAGPTLGGREEGSDDRQA